MDVDKWIDISLYHSVYRPNYIDVDNKLDSSLQT